MPSHELLLNEGHSRMYLSRPGSEGVSEVRTVLQIQPT